MDIKFEEYKKTLLRIIYEFLPECKVYLFGSRARQEHGQGADIDLALDNSKPIDLSVIYKIKNKIEESTIPLFVDIVDIHNADEVVKKEIENEGILWEK